MRPSSSLAVAFASVPRHRSVRDARAGALPVLPEMDVAEAVPARDASRWIRLRLRVASAQVFALRQTMHRAIGQLARVYVVEVDHRHGETTLHVEVEHGGRDAAMHAIMAALPAAEFGIATDLGADHAGH